MDGKHLNANRIDLRHLRTFVRVAEESSYSKAALRLRVAQPAVTRTIQQLEHDLGAQLFERSTRAVHLTRIGRFLLDRAREILASVGSTADSVRRMALGLSGELFVGFNDFTISEIIPPVLHRFRATYPDVQVNLSDAPSAQMAQQVSEGSLDVAFLSGVGPAADLDSFVLREEKFVVVLPRGHALERRRRIGVRDLKDEPFVLGGASWAVFLEAIDACCASAGFRPRVAQTAVHSNDIVNLVAAGIGASIYVERQWLRQRNDVIVRPLTGAPVKFRSLAMWRRSNPSVALANLLAVLRKTLS
jgi:DNA-binding transcriptional LysR family regulator